MRFLFCTLFLLSLFSAFAHVEGAERAVYLRPSADSPIIGELPSDGFFMAPAEPVELSQEQEAAGWEAISFLDDLRGFVRRTDLTKDLNVAPGAPVYATASENAANRLARAEANDLFQVERLSGDWVEVSFRKPVTAFIGPAGATAGTAETVETDSLSDAEPAILQNEPASAHSLRPEARPVISDRSAIPTDGILRAFEGRLAKPRSLFGRAPHEFQLVDASGNRIAYLDLSRLLITTPLEHFLGREFHFYGKAEPIEGRRDFVIRVEQMRQR